MTRIEQVSKFTDVIFSNGFIQVVNTSRLHRGKINRQKTIDIDRKY
jgi:hypothetical protein